MKHIGTYSKFIVRNGEVCRNEKNVGSVFKHVAAVELKKSFQFSMTGTLDTG